MKIGNCFLYLFFFSSFTGISSEDAQSVLFSEDLKKYYVEPCWVIPALIALPLESFDRAWVAFIDVIKNKDKQWVCVVSDKKKYSEKKYREVFLAQCAQYDIFLKNLIVDVPNKKLFLVSGNVAAYTQQPGLITIFQYWKAKKMNDYHHFYAFYFDRVAACFVETISNAFLQIDTSDYSKMRSKAYELLMKLHDIFTHLQGGCYDGRYAHHIQRYYEIGSVLQDEHKAFSRDSK